LKTPVSVNTVFGHPIHFLAFGFGSGLAPVAPGTFGTLVGIPFFFFMVSLPMWGYLSLILAFFLFGVWLCDRSSKMLGVHDHGGIVWDEIVGYLVTMIAAPGRLPEMQRKRKPYPKKSRDRLIALLE